MKNIKVKFKMLLIMTGVLVILLFGTIFSAICMKNQNNESVAEIEGSIRSSYDIASNRKLRRQYLSQNTITVSIRAGFLQNSLLRKMLLMIFVI